MPLKAHELLLADLNMRCQKVIDFKFYQRGFGGALKCCIARGMEPFWYCRFLKKSRKAINFAPKVSVTGDIQGRNKEYKESQ